MRQQRSPGIGWFPILLACFLFFAAFLYDGMGHAAAAYAPLSHPQAEQPEKGNGADGRAEPRRGVLPIHPADLLAEEDIPRILPPQEPRLPNLNTMAYPAICGLTYLRPLSELASRIGGHAPPK